MAEKKSKAGFSILEAVLAASLLIIIVSALVGAVIYGRESAVLGGARSRAALLAEEGLEAVRSIRDAGFENLVPGVHGLAALNSGWEFSGTEDQTGIFTRQIEISDIGRDRKEAISRVVWQAAPPRSGLVELVSRFTNWIKGNWGNPLLESELDFSGSQDGLKIQVAGNYAYAVRAGGNPDFLIIDIADTANPFVAGSLNLNGSPTNIFLEEDFAYISSEHNSEELKIVNVANPAAPVLAGTFDAPGNADARGIFVSGGYGYLVRDMSIAHEFLVLDVSNPNFTSFVSGLDLNGGGFDTTVSGGFGYVASGSNSRELQIVDLGNINSPSLAGYLDLPGNLDAVSIEGFGFYVALGRVNSGVYFIDVSVPGTPELVSSFPAGGNVNDLDVSSDSALAFLALSAAGREFQVLDISAINSPSLLGFLDLAGPLNGLAYHDLKDRIFGVGVSNDAEFTVIRPE